MHTQRQSPGIPEFLLSGDYGDVIMMMWPCDPGGAVSSVTEENEWWCGPWLGPGDPPPPGPDMMRDPSLAANVSIVWCQYQGARSGDIQCSFLSPRGVSHSPDVDFVSSIKWHKPGLGAPLQFQVFTGHRKGKGDAALYCVPRPLIGQECHQSLLIGWCLMWAPNMGHWPITRHYLTLHPALITIISPWHNCHQSVQTLPCIGIIMTSNQWSQLNIHPSSCNCNDLCRGSLDQNTESQNNDTGGNKDAEITERWKGHLQGVAGEGVGPGVWWG